MAFLFRGYVKLLQKHTLATQMVTGGVTSGLGDLIYQQGIERRGWANHEMYRTRRLIFYGSTIFAPCANRWHAFLNSINVGGRWTTVAVRGLVDMAIFAPFATSLFYVSQGVMESRPWKSVEGVQGIQDRLKERMWGTVQKQWMVFGPAQAINLTVMPVYARPPFMNLFAIGWSAFLAGAAQKGGLTPPIPTANLSGKTSIGAEKLSVVAAEAME